MKNLILSIQLPSGLKLLDGRVLESPATVRIIGYLEPFYTDIASVRLAGGSLLARLSDLALALAIFDASRRTRAICYREPAGGQQRVLWLAARHRYATLLAARELISGLESIAAYGGSRYLANFSISYPRGVAASDKLSRLDKELDELEIVLQSGGEVSPGGRPKPVATRKGVNQDLPPGRMWLVTGPGANAWAVEPSGTSGPVRYFAGPFYDWIDDSLS